MGSKDDSRRPKVYFDGDCYVCSLEVDHYGKNRGACQLDWVDITDQSFVPEREGLDSKRIHKVFHVRTASGELLEGVDAFREIWKNLPGYEWAYRISGFTPVRWAMMGGYEVFRRIRPYLPKKKRGRG